MVKFIKNIFLFFIIVRWILPNPVLLYVVHIPDLIDHFQLHQKEFGQVSVIDFVMEHLGDEQHHHHNAHAHDRLPFNHHTYAPNVTFFTSLNDSDFKLQEPVDASLNRCFKTMLHTDG